MVFPPNSFSEAIFGFCSSINYENLPGRLQPSAAVRVELLCEVWDTHHTHKSRELHLLRNRKVRRRPNTLYNLAPQAMMIQTA